jgi:hypothetical protein
VLVSCCLVVCVFLKKKAIDLCLTGGFLVAGGGALALLEEGNVASFSCSCSSLSSALALCFAIEISRLISARSFASAANCAIFSGEVRSSLHLCFS